MAVRPEESVEQVSTVLYSGKDHTSGAKKHAIKFKPLRGNNSFGGRTMIYPQYTHLIDCDLMDTKPGEPEELHIIFTHRTVVLRGFNLITMAGKIATHMEAEVKQEELGANGNQFVDIDKAVVTGMELMGPPE